MAPRKEKAEKVRANEAAAAVLNYLRKQNRPYSATDVSANLHNKVTKAAAAKILKDLHERSEIEGRPAGKQIVYHALQCPDSIIPSQIADLDATISSLRTQTADLQAATKTLRIALSSLNSTLSTSDLIASIQCLGIEKKEIVDRLASFKAGKAKNITKKEKNDVESEWTKWAAIAKRREKIAGEIWKLIEDVLPEGQKKGDVRALLGFEDYGE
ncbi:TBPIP-domain-containing protein [Lojkania enalia]|uniref:TBPIP-domain-containing protein n=1 Tax=Lojkania enalia TaxID=147567 RepID=A0A9P4JVU2_9PLEO|nr:TBPIP-domain-containing protein [Didymosphaeria enalia]